MQFPIVKVKTAQDVDNHICNRNNNIVVCTCIFEFVCKCGNVVRTQSFWGVKRQLQYGCHSCCPKKYKIRIKKNINPNKQQQNGGSKKAIGNKGEHYVAQELFCRGYQVFMGYTTNEEGMDLIIKSKKGQKHLDIQVKASDLDHNDYPNYNGNSCFSSLPSKIDFDFLIVYMSNYKLIWIVPANDLKTVFLFPNQYKPKEEWLCQFKMNWVHKDNPKDRKFPYQDAWHLIQTALNP